MTSFSLYKFISVWLWNK